MRTSFQSTSNSSAMIMGRCVLTPWPISGFFAVMVTIPFAATRINAVGNKGRGGRLRRSRLSGKNVRENGQVAGEQKSAAADCGNAKEGTPINGRR